MIGIITNKHPINTDTYFDYTNHIAHSQAPILNRYPISVSAHTVANH